MLKGIFPPITTPFVNQSIAYDKLKFNIERYNKFNLSGYVVFGSNGESPFLNNDEKVKMISEVKKFASKDKLIIAGTGSESIKETIKLSDRCADEGADYALILTPSFYKSSMDHQAFVDYFTAVAEEIKIPLLIYNVPKFTGVEISPQTVAFLSTHKNIIGIKSSSENLGYLSEIIQNIDNNFYVIAGTASILFPALTIGAKGGILALANIAPEECIEIYDLFINGELEQSKKIHLKLVELNKAVTAKYGVAGLKAAMDLLGYFGGDPMKPLRKLNLNQLDDLKSIMFKSGLIK